MEPKDKEKFFTHNKTSIIDYPKGIPEIEKYLVTMNVHDRDPIDALSAQYKEMSNIITEVAEYIKRESQSND